MTDIVFTTPRLKVRRPAQGDLSFVLSLYGDVELMKFLGGPLTEEMIQQRLNTWLDSWKSLTFSSSILVMKDTDEPVGQIAGFPATFEGRQGLEIGWILAKRFHGKRLATEAAHGLITFARKELGTKLFMAFPNTENLASHRILEKLGLSFVKETPYQYLDRTLQSSYWELNE